MNFNIICLKKQWFPAKSIVTYRFTSLFLFFQTGCSSFDNTNHNTEQIIIRDKQGFPMEIYTLKDTVLHGERILFYPKSKDTAIIESHQNGKFNGYYKSFFPKNKIKLSGQYVDDKMTGSWYKFDENGALVEKVTFWENEENGPFKEFYPSGQVRVSGNYKNGNKEDGPLYFYAENGKLIKKMYCSDGICRTQWKETNP
jgi:antitoxin component YwqK of YwqJK toxin-antitoxin module